MDCFGRFALSNDGETLSLLAARQSKAIASLIIHINKHTKADSRAWAFCCVFCFVDCHAANAARNDGVGALCEKVDSRIKLILGLNDSKHCAYFILKDSRICDEKSGFFKRV
ncbi:hypothetical protein [Helicobacter canis]|uniref:hypothetical protein n=1 Tax=Helicobacter canis TaxID=29419 RepID=UPI0029428071|nr:hypothetical protein [Helicobacter canis]